MHQKCNIKTGCLSSPPLKKPTFKFRLAYMSIVKIQKESMQYLKKPCLEILAWADKSGNIYWCHFTNFLPQVIIYSISSPELGALVTYLCSVIVRPFPDGKEK